MGSPLDHKSEFCLWTLAIIRSMIAQERGVDLSKSAVSRLLAHLGLSPQRSLYKLYKQEQKSIERYLQKTFPEVVERAHELGAEIYFVEEVAVRTDTHHGRTEEKTGETPVVRDSGGRFGPNIISAVTLRGDMCFSMMEGNMSSARFIQFLKELRKDAGRPIIAITDNARYRHSKETRRFIEAEALNIMITFLPEYAPELDPDE